MAQRERNLSNTAENRGGNTPRRASEGENQNFAKRFNSQWIQSGVDEEAVQFADDFGRFLVTNKMTTSQIRNVFGEIKRIQIKGFDEEKPGFYLLKPKMAYAASRVERPKAKGINEFKKVFDQAHGEVKNNKDRYMNFVDFFEAILAYHKAHGGKDNG